MSYGQGVDLERDGESIEDLAGLLIHQIRSSDFLSENPPRGESIFLHDKVLGAGNCVDEDDLFTIDVTQAECSNASGSGGESVESIARSLMMQLRHSGLSDSACPASRPAGSSTAGEQPSDEFAKASTQSVAQRVEPAVHAATTGSESGPTPPAGRPTLNDALGFVFAELDRGHRSSLDERTLGSSATGFGLVGDDDEEDLVAAFQAMAPTLDAFVLEMGGKLSSPCNQHANGDQGGTHS